MNVALDFEVHVKLLFVCGHVFLYLRFRFFDLFVRDPLAPANGKEENGILNHLGEVEGPLNITLKQVEEVTRMFFDPLAQLEVIVSSHTEDKEVHPLDLFLDLFGVLIDNLPPKSKSDEDRQHSYSREEQGDVGQHLAEHGANTIHSILVIMDAFEQAVGHDHVERAHCEVEW